MSQAGNYADCEICSYKIHSDDADYWKRRCEAAEALFPKELQNQPVDVEWEKKWDGWKLIIKERKS